MIDITLIIVLVLVVGASVFFSWTLFGLFRSHVPFISTSRRTAQRMVALAQLKPNQKVYDLGCGRGAILFEALHSCPPLLKKEELHPVKSHRAGVLFHGVKEDFPKTQFIGYELVRPVVWMANIRKFFVGTCHGMSLRFLCADFFKEDLSDADVIFCYLWPSIMDRFYAEKWDTLNRGTKIVSHGFEISKLTPQKIDQEGKTKIFVYEKGDR
ncbi:hypothetical protein K9L63_02615 [Candidatus Gracilibacteria bacterium]|nr:hypothetical protein [Candidatus Gracilibacteria bacterium]